MTPATYTGEEILINGASANPQLIIPNFTVVASGGGSSSGDPYIKSANGKITKLPNKSAMYRFFQHSDMFINVEVDKKNIEHELRTYIAKFNFDYIDLGEMISDGYFNKNIYINSEGRIFKFNLFNMDCIYDKTYYNICMFKNRKNRDLDDFTGETVIPVTIAIVWSHSKYGKQRILLDFFNNPQVQNNITFDSNLLTNNESCGILCKNYKAKLMELSDIENVCSREIVRNIEKVEKRGKSPYHTKTIKRKEVWIKHYNNGKMAINRKYD